MTTRQADCSCGQLHLTIEGEPSRTSMCHCLECQRRTGGVISNQARFRREQVTFAGKATAWMRTAEIRRRCHRQLRRPKFSGTDHRGVGGVASPLGLVAGRYAV
jgi:hypothetical protein